MACSSGCPRPGTHASWGECVRSKSLQFADIEAHAYNNSMVKSCTEYVAARKAGLQPDGILPGQVAKAWKETDRTGTPYRADA